MNSYELCLSLKGYNEIVGVPPYSDGWNKVIKMVEETVSISHDSSPHTRFVVWLSGYIELAYAKAPDPTQWEKITKRLYAILDVDASKEETTESFIKTVLDGVGVKPEIQWPRKGGIQPSPFMNGTLGDIDVRSL